MKKNEEDEDQQGVKIKITTDDRSKAKQRFQSYFRKLYSDDYHVNSRAKERILEHVTGGYCNVFIQMNGLRIIYEAIDAGIPNLKILYLQCCDASIVNGYEDSLDDEDVLLWIFRCFGNFEFSMNDFNELDLLDRLIQSPIIYKCVDSTLMYLDIKYQTDGWDFNTRGRIEEILEKTTQLPDLTSKEKRNAMNSYSFALEYEGEGTCQCGASYPWHEWDEIEDSDEYDIDECPNCKIGSSDYEDTEDDDYIIY